MNNKKIQELFSTPTGLSPEITISGTTFYSSEKLKNSFSIAFNKSSKGKHVSSDILKLVQKGLVLPCYKSKNVFSFIKNKLSKDPEKYILAFYSVDDKKVIILIDNSTTIFGTSSNNELISTTLHECMHLAAGNNINKFIQIFNPYLQNFYSTFFEDYFALKEKPKDEILDIIKFLSKYEKYGLVYINKDLTNYFHFLYSLFKDKTKFTDQDFQIRLTNYIVAAKLFVVSISTLLRNKSKFEMLFTSLNNSYYKSFGKKNKYTTPIQETISLSEVACVLAEMDSKEPVIKKLLQIIT